jgi:hypothetical protein
MSTMLPIITREAAGQKLQQQQQQQQKQRQCSVSCTVRHLAEVYGLLRAPL